MTHYITYCRQCGTGKGEVITAEASLDRISMECPLCSACDWDDVEYRINPQIVVRHSLKKDQRGPVVEIMRPIRGDPVGSYYIRTYVHFPRSEDPQFLGVTDHFQGGAHQWNDFYTRMEVYQPETKDYRASFPCRDVDGVEEWDEDDLEVIPVPPAPDLVLIYGSWWRKVGGSEDRLIEVDEDAGTRCRVGIRSAR